MSEPITDKVPRWAWIVLPLALLLGSIALFLATNPLEPLGVTAPPIEEVTVERVTLDEQGIHLSIRVNGSEPVRIAQVLVDEGMEVLRTIARRLPAERREAFVAAPQRRAMRALFRQLAEG